MADKTPKELAQKMETGRQFVVILVNRVPGLDVKDNEIETIRTHLQEKTLPWLQSGWIRTIPLDCYPEFEAKMRELIIRTKEARKSEVPLVEFTVLPYPIPGQPLECPPDASDRVKELVKKANKEAQFDVFPTVIHEGVVIVKMMLSADYDQSGSLVKEAQERVNAHMEELAKRLNEFEDLAEKKDADGIKAYHEKYHPAPKPEKVEEPVKKTRKKKSKVEETEDLVAEFKDLL